MNEFMINPAVAGADGMTTLNITGRKEWLGFAADVPTPETYSASFQTRFLKKSTAVKTGIFGKRLSKASTGRVGFGIGVISDYNGAMQRTGLNATYAYHIFLHEAQLSFGLTASIAQMKIRSKYLNFKDNDEPLLNMANNSYWIPDFGAGINYLQRNFHIGFSVSQLLESQFVLGSSGINTGDPDIHYKRNYNLMSSYKHVISAGSGWEYEPSILVKMYDPVQFKPAFSGPMLQADMMLRLIYQKGLWCGLAYRTSKEYVVLLGIKVQKLYVSYSFDYGTNSISSLSYGSHEISISLKLGDSARRLPWMERY
jgi:type IX secretion system PorP/SprF family membrane protein